MTALRYLVPLITIILTLLTGCTTVRETPTSTDTPTGTSEEPILDTSSDPISDPSSYPLSGLTSVPTETESNLEDPSIDPTSTILSPTSTISPLSKPPASEGTPEPQINIMAEDEAVELAKRALSEELGVGIEEIQVVSITAKNWSDASLGCPKPGRFYAQIIVHGHLVVLQVDSTQYNVHTGDGRAVVCQ